MAATPNITFAGTMHLLHQSKAVLKSLQAHNGANAFTNHMLHRHPVRRLCVDAVVLLAIAVGALTLYNLGYSVLVAQPRFDYRLQAMVLTCADSSAERRANAAALCRSARAVGVPCGFHYCVSGAALLTNRTLRCQLASQQIVAMQDQLPGKVAAGATYAYALRRAESLLQDAALPPDPTAGHFKILPNQQAANAASEEPGSETLSSSTPRNDDLPLATEPGAMLFLEDDAVLRPDFWPRTFAALAALQPGRWHVLSLYDRQSIYSSPRWTSGWWHWAGPLMRVWPGASYAYNVAEIVSEDGIQVMLDNLPVQLTTKGPRGQGRDKWMGTLNDEGKLIIYSTRRPLVVHDSFPSHIHSTTSKGLIDVRDCQQNVTPGVPASTDA